MAIHRLAVRKRCHLASCATSFVPAYHAHARTRAHARTIVLIAKVVAQLAQLARLDIKTIITWCNYGKTCKYI